MPSTDEWRSREQGGVNASSRDELFPRFPCAGRHFVANREKAHLRFFCGAIVWRAVCASTVAKADDGVGGLCSYSLFKELASSADPGSTAPEQVGNFGLRVFCVES